MFFAGDFLQSLTAYESLHISVSSWYIETYSRLGRMKALTGGDAIRPSRMFSDYYPYAHNAVINRALSTAITGYAVRDTMYNADFDGDAMNGLHVPDDDYDDLPDLVNVDDDWYTNPLDTITASDIATAVT